MSEWVETTLGEVTTRRTDFTPVDLDTDYVILGVQRSGWGFMRNNPKRGRDQKFAKLMRVGQDDLVYRTITAFEAPAAVVGKAEEGLFVTPQTFPVYRLDHARVLPGYMRLLTTWTQFHHEMAERCTGTVLRRKTLSINAFAAIPICLPSLAEQRRIVDVMAAVDAQIKALEVEVERMRRLLAPLAQNVFDELGGENVRLGDVLTIVRGGSPRPIDNYFTTDPDGLNWIKIGDVARGGKYITNTAQKIKPDGLRKTRFVRAGSFLLSNSMSFGRPYILAIDGCIHDGWLSLTDEKNSFSADFLYYLLRSQATQEQFERLAAGSGVRNLNIKSVQGVVVSLPSLAEQLEAVKRLNELSVSADASGDEFAASRAFRSTLLSSLLSQDVEIPESYEVLLAAGLEVVS